MTRGSFHPRADQNDRGGHSTRGAFYPPTSVHGVARGRQEMSEFTH